MRCFKVSVKVLVLGDDVVIISMVEYITNHATMKASEEFGVVWTYV